MIYLKNIKKLLKPTILGLGVGFINGVFGAGGGMLAVPILKSEGLSQKNAHANAVAVILPITVLSAVLYLVKGSVSLADSLAFIPTGLIGSVIAAFTLQKFSNKWLQKIFAAFMIYAGVRLLLR